MKLSKPDMCLAILVVTTLAVLATSLQAAAQAATPDPRSSRGGSPRGQPSNAAVQVWVGVDVLPGGVPVQGLATDLSAASMQNQNSRFAGVWRNEAIPGLVLTLQLNGDFALVTPVNLDRRCAAGVERGNWLESADTNELLFYIKTDTSGRCGFSDLDSTMTVVKTESGLAVIISDTQAGEQQLPLIRAEP